MRTNEELKKMASLERTAIKNVDVFIDHRIQRGDSDGVPLRRFIGLVADERNLHDYIGHSEDQLSDFFSARRHLWTMQKGGLIGKVPSTTRFILLESAVFINNRRGSTKKRADIFDIAGVLRTKWPTESWTSNMVKTTLDTYPELFKVDDMINTWFECRVWTVGDVILPESLLSPISASRIDGILNKNDDDRYSSSTNSESVATYGGGVRGLAAKYGGERPYSSSGAAAAAESIPTTDADRGDTARSTIEGVGEVIRVCNDFAFAFVGKTSVFCHISKFDEKFEEPLTDHISIDDELHITAVVARNGRYVGKWKAKRVSTKKSPPEHDRRDRDRSDAMDRHRGPSDNRTVSPDRHHRRSNSPPIARSTNSKRSATSAFNGAGASSYSAAAQDAVRSVHDQAEPTIKKKKEVDKILVDVGVQAEETDGELLLRVLRRFPNSRFSME